MIKPTGNASNYYDKQNEIANKKERQQKQLRRELGIETVKDKTPTRPRYVRTPNGVQRTFL